MTSTCRLAPVAEHHGPAACTRWIAAVSDITRVAPLLLTIVLGLWSPAGRPADLVSYASVREDGSLLVRGRTVRLYGVYIPPTERTCQTFLSPVRCAPRAVLQLDFKIGSRFVHCDRQARSSDGSVSAICRVNGEDLGAWLLSQGWALATPDAPFEYHALERIARSRQVGVWGFAVDAVQ